MSGSTVSKELLQQAYNKGYSQGYRAGYHDASSDISQGVTRTYAPNEILNLPIQDLNLSTRAINCLSAAGCKYISDIILLSDDQVRYMQKLGKVTANEIAKALERYHIKNTVWAQYLYVSLKDEGFK